jgi:glyoxylase-like metal-dependent hydrolase (beta-lactamase superfamily II)
VNGVRVVRILAPNPSVYTLEGTNTWIVGDPPSIVVDPGPSIAAHLDEVAAVAGRVGAVLVTHDHPDHAPGAPGFARRVGAPLYAFRLDGAEHLRDGQRLEVGAVSVVSRHTPGHTSDHLVFELPDERLLFTGDAVLGRGTSFIDPPDGDLALYLRSLRRMQDLHPRILYPGHGPVVLDAASKLQEYLDHRADREAQVLGSIATAPRTIMEMVREIYSEYPPEVHPLAARSVLAHLLKLQGEGRVSRSGRGLDAEWSTVSPTACARCGRPVNGRARYCGTCSLILLQEAGSAEAGTAGKLERPEPD